MRASAAPGAFSELRESVPVVFGAAKDLFGVLTLPADESAGGLGVLICSPLWHQNVCSYRPLRTLAVRIGERGLPVLRFDWPGCGDSLDTRAGSDRAEGWSTAVAEALSTLRTATDVDEVALIGLRVGGTLALHEALANPLVSRVALLAPYASGQAYLRELRAFEALAEQTAYSKPHLTSPPLPEGSFETGGFLVSAEEVRALEELDLRSEELWQRVPRRVFVMTTHDERAMTRLAALARGAGAAVSEAVEPELAHMWDSSQVSYLPPSCRDRVLDWLLAEPPTGSPQRRAPTGASPEAVLDGPGFRERAVSIPCPRGETFAIRCSPRPARQQAGDWVIFLNTGRVRRIGTNRFSTLWARGWAKAGVPSLRLDVPGVGDGEGAGIGDETLVADPAFAVQPPLLRDLTAVLDWLAEHEQARRFTVIGLSSGATLAFQLAVQDERVVGVGMMNPPALVWDDRLLLLKEWDAARASGGDARSLLRSARSLGGSWSRDALRGNLLQFATTTLRTTHRRKILESLERLQRQGTVLAAVFRSGDQGLRYLERVLGRDYPARLEGLGVMVDTISGPDHTFRPLWSHPYLQEAFERLLLANGFLSWAGAAGEQHQALRPGRDATARGARPRPPARR